MVKAMIRPGHVSVSSGHDLDPSLNRAWEITMAQVWISGAEVR